MKEVIQEAENRGILQANLTHMDYLLHYTTTVLQGQLPEAPRETLKVWLQLLHNCLTQAKSILSRSNSRQLCLDCLSNNSQRASKQVKNWKVHFDYLFQALESDISVFVRGREAVIAPVIAPIIPLMKDVMEEEEKRHILQTELKPLDNILLDISAVFQDQDKAAPEPLKIWLQLLHNSLTEAKSILQRYGTPSQRQWRLDCLMEKQARPPKQEIKERKVFFNYLFQGLQSEFSMFVIGDYLVNRDPIPAVTTSEESVQALSQDEAWTLFRRIAFKDDPVPTDIEECAHNIVDECKGFLLAINLVAAAMRGKTRLGEWNTCLSSIKIANSSSDRNTLHPRFDPELYPLLRWSYDALPNSDVKNCFLYCAMYPKDEKINVEGLVGMWIAQGFVRSKQGHHLMDMAIGRSYVNLLADRCFFQNAAPEAHILQLPEYISIRVHHVVREMAIYVGEEEENCLFKAGEGLKIFPEIQNEDCKRISVLKNGITNLPNELQCPKLVSLMLSVDNSIEEIPPGFVASLTSLKVLRLHGSKINSTPSSVGQLKQLEFLSLRELDNIQVLPGEIGHLSSLQILDLQNCFRLQSLPSRLGDLKNLKHLRLDGCSRLKVIPHEISQLTSLSTLEAWGVELSVEAESEASIWRLKGLRNLTMLTIEVREGLRPRRIEEGIMGTWLDTRHLKLRFDGDHLPQDMKKMSKLQHFVLSLYEGSSLPDYIYNFQHLQGIWLRGCHQLRELSPLGRVPNLKAVCLTNCRGLKELGKGNSGGFLMLEKLVLFQLWDLESIGGASDNGVWNESTLPRLRRLLLEQCPKSKRLPMGMDKLPKLNRIFARKNWWNEIIWEDRDMKLHLDNYYLIYQNVIFPSEKISKCNFYHL